MGGRQDVSLRELLARLIDSAKAFAQAEIALVRATAAAWAGAVKIGAALIAVALVLALSGAIVLLAAFGVALGHWLGLAGGLAVAAVIALLIAGLLLWLAARRFLALMK